MKGWALTLRFNPLTRAESGEGFVELSPIPSRLVCPQLPLSPSTHSRAPTPEEED